MKRALLNLYSARHACARGAFAHEVRPAYLELRQTGPETYDALWKVPGQGDLRLGLYVELPAGCTQRHRAAGSMVNNAYTERWTVKCAGGLTGGTIHIAGLSATSDRRARASGTSRRHHASHAAHAVRRRRSWSRPRQTRVRRRPHVHRARRRAHPHGHRPSAVRARADHHHARRLEAGQDRHRVHRLAQHHAHCWRRSATCTSRNGRSKPSSR